MGKKGNVVGEVPFESGVPEPKVKSPLDRHTIEKQMVAETIISHGFDSWFDEPEKTEESDGLFESYDTGAIDDRPLSRPNRLPSQNPRRPGGPPPLNSSTIGSTKSPRRLLMTRGISDRG